MTSNLSRQYLKAMGIDCWSIRDTPSASLEGIQDPRSIPQSDDSGPDSVVTSNATPNAQSAGLGKAGMSGKQETVIVQQPAAEQQPKQVLPIARWTPETVDASLRDCQLLVTNSLSGGNLLLVLERALSPQAEDLLSAMLKAINVDRLSQGIATFAPASGGQPFATVVAAEKPSIVILMALVTDSSDLSELDRHRQEYYRLPWLGAPLAITVHPQVLLDNPQAKRPAWEDLKRVKAFLDG